MLKLKAINTGIAQAASISDIDKCSDYAKASIQSLVEKNIISGDQNSNFHPHDTLKRDEFVKLLVKALNIDTTNVPNVQTFTDVPKTHWAFPYVEAAYLKGIIKGTSNNLFGADVKCTREQMAAMFVRSMGLNDDNIKGIQDYYYTNRLNDSDNISVWAKDYVEFAMTAGLMNGTGGGNFGAGQFAQREQAAVLTDRFLTNQAKVEKLAEGYLGNVDYPELYNAIKSSNQSFKGGLDADYLVKLADLSGSGEAFDIDMKMNGVVDGKNFDVTYNMSTSGVAGVPSSSQQFRIISKDKTLYMKEPGSTLWTKMSMQDELGSGLITDDSSSGKVLKYYLTSNVTKDGQVELNGATATKYTLTLNSDTFNQLMQSSPLLENGEAAGQMDQLLNNAGGQIEYYLDANNNIIKQYVEFSGILLNEDNTQSASMNITLDVNYNTAALVDIKAPDPSEISK